MIAEGGAALAGERWIPNADLVTYMNPVPAEGVKRGLAPPGHRVGDDPLVVDLADDLLRVVPDLQAARGLGVLDRIGCHLADREREVDRAGLGQPGLDGIPAYDGPDRGQVSGVVV